MDYLYQDDLLHLSVQMLQLKGELRKLKRKPKSRRMRLSENYEASFQIKTQENLLEFKDDGMTLIYRLINKQVAQEMRTQIYDRLMEPDVDAEVEL